MRGCQFGFFLFVTLAFGILVPTWLVIMHVVLTLSANYENNWFRNHGVVETAVVVDKQGTHLRNEVIVYQVNSSGTRKQFRERPPDFDRIAIGDDIKVWVAGEHARKVQIDRPVITKKLWFLACPVASVVLLGFVILRVAGKQATHRESPQRL